MNKLIQICFICLISGCGTLEIATHSSNVKDKYINIDSLRINPLTFNNGWQSLSIELEKYATYPENCISISKPIIFQTKSTIEISKLRRDYKLACPSHPEKYIAPKGCLLITEVEHHLRNDGHDKKVNRYYLQCTPEGAAIAEKELGVAITDEQREEDRKACVGSQFSEPCLKK